MPTYEYRCKACGQELEVVQSFTDDALTTCEACGGPLRKVFGNVGIAFKGSGFYKNDSRGKSTAAVRGRRQGRRRRVQLGRQRLERQRQGRTAATSKPDAASTPSTPAPAKADKPKTSSTSP